MEVRLVEETVNAPDCELPGCPPPCYEEGRLEDWKDDFWTAKQTWASLRNQLPTITDSATRASTIRNINIQRRNMDIHGQNVLGHYMLDSLVSRPDSVFAWLSNLETYGADWHLVQHHFFSENLSLADSLMGIMPGKHDLDSDEITRHANSEDLLNLLRDEVEAGTDLTSFPENLVEALYEYETDCYAAGALARALLMLNDREPAAPDCASAEVRPVGSHAVDAANALKVYPNPAKDVVNIKVGGLGNSIHQIDLVDMGGRTRLRKSCPAGQTQCEVGLTDLPAGIYLVKATLSTGKTSLQKLTIHR